ncbi:MAG: translation elongation factor 4 [bacterium]|nr:translation elongation factor 4 [bacterium]
MLTQTRNFSIIAHIDHGKSTLADRFLELSSGKLNSVEQVLDSMDLERERGITIKLKPVKINLTVDKTDYTFNLIDTPGHVDFSYEVSRSLAACEGALLLVDSVKGVQAQTIANTTKAIEQGLEIIPVINKIDLINAEVERVEEELFNVFGFRKEEIIRISAKTGQNLDLLVKEIIDKIPAPKRNSEEFNSLIFDSYFDVFQGAIALVRVFGGEVKVGDKLRLLNAKKDIVVEEVGVFIPQKLIKHKLESGEVGYIVTGEKDISFVKVGDTISELGFDKIFPGYKEPQRVVYKGIYPINGDDFEGLRLAFQKLNLQDSSFTYSPDVSGALGQGFKCGFLGNLHAEIIESRIEREFDIPVFTTPPTVMYYRGEEEVVRPSDMKTTQEILTEPWVNIQIIVKDEYVGQIMTLVAESRGEFVKMEYLTTTENNKRVNLIYNMPLSEVISGFFDNLKSVSSGYASLDYTVIKGREVKVNKLDIFIAGESVDALSRIVIDNNTDETARKIAQKLKVSIPKQQFAVAIQVSIGGKVLAREDISAYRKDVTQKLYGGDKTRRYKLLEKQKVGKKKMKSLGKIEVSSDVFRKISAV